VVVLVFKLSNIGFLCEFFAPSGSIDFKLSSSNLVNLFAHVQFLGEINCRIIMYAV
jgi:hypothetical protein